MTSGIGSSVLRVVVTALLAGCGGATKPTSSSATGTDNAPIATPHAPSCTYDAAWDEQFAQRDNRDVWRMLLFAGKPAYTTTDRDRKRVQIRNLDSGDLLAELALPAQQGFNVFPDEVMETADGPLIFATGAAEPKEGDLALTTAYWLVQFDRTGKASPAVPVPLPSGYGWETTMIAVGDFRVALLTEPKDPPEDLDTPSPQDDNHLVIVDKRGNVVRSLREKAISAIYAIGDHAFAVVTEEEVPASAAAKRENPHAREHIDHVRVFDVARLDWGGPAAKSEYRISDGLSVGPHAILLGARRDPAHKDASHYALATLNASGAVSAWKPLGLSIDARLASSFEPGVGLVVLQLAEPRETSDDITSIVAFNAVLDLAPSARGMKPIPGGLGTSTLATKDALYISSWGRPNRLACSRE